MTHWVAPDFLVVIASAFRSSYPGFYNETGVRVIISKRCRHEWPAKEGLCLSSIHSQSSTMVLAAPALKRWAIIAQSPISVFSSSILQQIISMQNLSARPLMIFRSSCMHVMQTDNTSLASKRSGNSGMHYLRPSTRCSQRSLVCQASTLPLEPATPFLQGSGICCRPATLPPARLTKISN